MIINYTISIERLAEIDGDGYLAKAIELPGCMSDGATPEEALVNVRDAIRSWIEAAVAWNMIIPDGRSGLE